MVAIIDLAQPVNYPITVKKEAIMCRKIVELITVPIMFIGLIFCVLTDKIFALEEYNKISSLTIINPLKYGIEDYPVTIKNSLSLKINNIEGKMIVIMDSDKNIIPSQIDDIDLSGTITEKDELVLLVTIPKESIKRYEVVESSNKESMPAYLDKKGYDIVDLGDNGSFTLKIKKMNTNFAGWKSWEGIKKVFESKGPIRELYVYEKEIEGKTTLTMRIELYPGLMRIINILAPKEGIKDVSINSWVKTGFDSIDLNAYSISYKWTGGFEIFEKEKAIGRKPLPLGVSSFDFAKGDVSVAILNDSNLDIIPGASLYYEGWLDFLGLTFGWKKNFKIPEPRIETLTIIPHTPGMDNFKVLDSIYRAKNIMVFSEENLKEQIEEELTYIKGCIDAVDGFQDIVDSSILPKLKDTNSFLSRARRELLKGNVSGATDNYLKAKASLNNIDMVSLLK